MDPGLSLLISGLGSAVIAGGANYFGSSNLNKKNREWQEKMYGIQKQDQEDFYKNFQSPEAIMSSQLRGMLENGINPALMFEGAPTTGQNPVNLPNVPQASNAAISNFTNASDWDIYSKIVQARRLKAETTLMEEQQEKVRAETVLANYKAFNEGQIGFGQYLENVFDQRTMDARVAKQLNETAESYYDVDLKEMEKEIKSQTKDDVIRALQLSDEKITKENNLLDQQFKEITQRINESESRVKVNDQTVKLLWQQTVAQQFENEITRITKNSEASKTVAENTLSEMTAQFGIEFAEKHGINPFCMDEFRLAFVSALEGVAGEKNITVDELLNSKNSLDWRNVVTKLASSLGPTAVFAGVTLLTKNPKLGLGAATGTSALLQGLFDDPNSVPGVPFLGQ